MSSDAPNTPSSPSCRTRAPTPSCKPADACFCRSLTASKQSLTTTEKSSPLTPKSQPRLGRYAILPSLTTRGNVASTNTRTASSDSTSKKVQTSLCCLMPMSKGSRINSTHAPERYSAIRHVARFSPTPRLCVLHFTVEWAREQGIHSSEQGIPIRCSDSWNPSGDEEQRLDQATTTLLLGIVH